MPVTQVALLFFFSSRRRHTRLQGDWSSDVCSSDLVVLLRGAIAPVDRVGPGQGGELLHPGDQLLVLGKCLRGGRALGQGTNQLLFSRLRKRIARFLERQTPRKALPDVQAILSHTGGR